MVFGRNMIPLERGRHRRPARLRRVVPRAAWAASSPARSFPFGQEQIVRCAEPHFRLVSSASGRLDYIETIRQWRERFARAEPAARRCSSCSCVPRWLTSADFRLAFTSGVSANSVCFERELLDHYRLVFEKDA